MSARGWNPKGITHVQGDAAARKAQPITRGCLDYFPDALLAVAELSRIGNEQHNPGQPMHWAKEKSTDEADALVRHLIDRGTVDTDGVRHSTKVAWRALALLQREIDAERSPVRCCEGHGTNQFHFDPPHGNGCPPQRVETYVPAATGPGRPAERYPGQLAGPKARPFVTDDCRPDCSICGRPDCFAIDRDPAGNMPMGG